MSAQAQLEEVQPEAQPEEQPPVVELEHQPLEEQETSSQRLALLTKPN
jgi:hypothetical protein